MDYPAVVAERKKAEEIKNMLMEMNMLDDSRRIVERDGKILIPVKERIEGFDIIEQRNPVFREVFPPFEEIKRRLKGKISHRDFSNLPDKWEKFGDVLVLKMDGIDEKRKIAEVYASVLKCRAVLEDVEGIYGVMRTPSFRFIVGKNAETVHVENGIKYKFDVSKIMFSSGNIDERIRMGKIVRKDEVAIDMFAGIGYFSIPMAVNGARVYAIELNPVAYEYLNENAKLNGVEDRIKTFLGDCRDVEINIKADRIVMGYLNSLDYLEYAFKWVKKGSIIHLHQNSRIKEFPDSVFMEAERIAMKMSHEIELMNARKIKSYAPHIIHGVLDLKVK
ncbi:MAG: class I SAM-dependent methyltransferase family protein [Thermoplasmata archaeon]|nr:class I SAM-dependent methyltransferase family protein [Thermoplasmata archaeon]